MTRNSIESLAAKSNMNMVWFGNSVYAKYQGQEHRLGSWITLKHWTSQQWQSAFDSIINAAQSREYLPGFELVHEGLVDDYCPLASIPQEALDLIVSSPLNAVRGIEIYDGMGFKVYRRVQRPQSVLWDLEYIGMVYYHRNKENCENR
jgi:hypothetical protein